MKGLSKQLREIRPKQRKQRRGKRKQRSCRGKQRRSKRQDKRKLLQRRTMPQKLEIEHFGRKAVLTWMKLFMPTFAVCVLDHSKKILALEENSYNVVARDGSMKFALIRIIWIVLPTKFVLSACLSMHF